MASGVERQRAGLDFERELWGTGHCLIAGLDEVGRGAWAGPVVAAAVILPPPPASLASLLGHVDDSKRLSPPERERLSVSIRERAVAAAIGSVPACEVDRIGIVAATRLAMLQALSGLSPQPDFLLLDFLTLPEIRLPQRGLPHGDALSLSIAAASIVAKVDRDRWMAGQDAFYAGYGFGRHKGYGTAEHQEALRRLGPCPLHRFSFQPLVNLSGSHEGDRGVSPAGPGYQGDPPVTLDHTPRRRA